MDKMWLIEMERAINMNRLRVLYILCGCLLFGGCSVLFAGDRQGSEVHSQEDLLDFLFEQNEAGREKIKSYSFTLEADQKSQKNLTTRNAEVKCSGDNLWCTQLLTQRNHDGELMLERETRMVVNDRFSSIWKSHANGTADQYLHRSVNAIDTRRKNTIRINTPHQFMGYCFGRPRMSLREEIAAHKKLLWRAIESKSADGKKVYEIWRSPNDPGPTVKVKWVLDPEKGYLATECTAYFTGTGVAWYRRVMDVEEVAKGIWFPVGFREERRDQHNEDVVLSEATFRLKDIIVNKDIPDEQFEFDALNLQEDMPDVIVLQYALDSGRDQSPTPYVYYEGRLVPQKVVRWGKRTGDVEAEIEAFEKKEDAICTE